MKNVSNFALYRTSIISLICIAIILFSISSIERATKKVVLEIAESKVNITGTGSLGKWKMETNAIDCQGSFETKDDELLTISDLSFTLPVNSLKSNNHELETMLNEVFNKNNRRAIVFKQQSVMILPIMKKIHVIGELSLLNGAQSLPLQVNYELTNDQTLTITGKQMISLSQYGLKLPSHMAGTIDDEVEIEINFVLVNKSI